PEPISRSAFPVAPHDALYRDGSPPRPGTVALHFASRIAVPPRPEQRFCFRMDFMRRHPFAGLAMRQGSPVADESSEQDQAKETGGAAQATPPASKSGFLGLEPSAGAAAVTRRQGRAQPPARP